MPHCRAAAARRRSDRSCFVVRCGYFGPAPELRQDKSRGVIPENGLHRLDPEAIHYTFAVRLGTQGD